MKIVINKCFGGFSLSPLATKLYAESLGKKCYFFKHEYVGLTRLKRKYTICDISEIDGLFWDAYSIPNPEVLEEKKPWHEMSDQEKDEHNKKHNECSLYFSNLPRTDETLIKIIEDIGPEAASGNCARLAVIEIPDGIEYEISEYDGFEHIAEVHRTWG